MLRRLEKRILVDLPSLEAREAMLKQYLPPSIHSGEGSVEIKTEIDYGELAKVTMKPSHENILMITLSVYSFSSIRHLLPMRGISPLCPLVKGEGRWGRREQGWDIFSKHLWFVEDFPVRWTIYVINVGVYTKVSSWPHNPLINSVGLLVLFSAQRVTRALTFAFFVRRQPWGKSGRYSTC